MGPMTGRGLGFCATGWPAGAYTAARPWSIPRAGLAYRRGMRGGWMPYPYYGGMPAVAPGMTPFAPEMSREEELEFLKDQANAVKEQLEQIEQRMRDLEKEK